MIWRRGFLILATVVVILTGAACSDSGDGDGGSGIPVQDPDLVAAGDTLYQANCASCHGTDLRGTDQGPSHLSVVYEPGHHGDAAFLLAARNGTQQHHWRFGNMEPVPGLSDEDIAAMVAFVRETQRTQGFEPYPP